MRRTAFPLRTASSILQRGISQLPVFGLIFISGLEFRLSSVSAVAGATALAKFDPDHLVAGILSIVVTALSSVMTLLNPNQKGSAHLNAGNNYDALMNRTRIFWSIDCWREESEEVLTEKLKYLSEQKDKLNQSCPQIPRWAHAIAQRGIKSGEAAFEIDRG